MPPAESHLLSLELIPRTVFGENLRNRLTWSPYGRTLPLEGFEILIPEAKFGYLTTAKGKILKIAGIHDHSREELASVLRNHLEHDYIYRLQHNQDETVQFTLILELPRDDAHPVKVAVGLKYFPEKQALSLVTLT